MTINNMNIPPNNDDEEGKQQEYHENKLDELPALMSAVKSLLENRERTRNSTFPYDKKNRFDRRGFGEKKTLKDYASSGSSSNHSARNNSRELTRDFMKLIKDSRQNPPQHMRKRRSSDMDLPNSPLKRFHGWKNYTRDNKSRSDSNIPTNSERRQFDGFKKEFNQYSNNNSYSTQRSQNFTQPRQDNFRSNTNPNDDQRQQPRQNSYQPYPRIQNYRTNNEPMITDKAKTANSHTYGQYYKYPFYRGNDMANARLDSSNIRWPRSSNTQYMRGEGLKGNYNSKQFNAMNTTMNPPKLMKQYIHVRPDWNSTSITQHFDLEALCEKCGNNIQPHSIGQCPKRRSPRQYYYSATNSPVTSPGTNPNKQ